MMPAVTDRLRFEALACTNASMTGWKRSVAILGGLILAGGICVAAIPYIYSPKGVIGPTILQAQSPIGAGVALIVCLTAASIVGAVIGRLINAIVGLFVVGVGLGALALRFGSIQDVAFAGDGSLRMLALETVLWAAAVLGSTLLVFKLAGPLPDFVPADEEEDKPAWSHWTLGGAVGGVVILPIVWLIARSELRGQTIAATIIGGLFAGLLARLLSPHTQPRLIFAATCLMGALGHLVGALVVGRSDAGGFNEVYVASALPTISYALPIDYAVGSFIGVAMGLGWAASFLQHEHEDDAAPGRPSSVQ